MKRLLYSLLLLPLLVGPVGCTSTEEIEKRLDDVEGRVNSLEDRMAELNSQVSLIRQLLSGKYFVTGVSELEGGEGYQLLLVDGSGNSYEYVVRNGQNGKDGKDGQNGKDGADGKDGKDGKDGQNGQNGQDGKTPDIGIRQDTDGNYYWTINGEWLLVNGEKVRANGQDGKDGQDGQDGKDGQDGQDGKDGQNGQDGKDGENGKDGQNGQDGQDGKDGQDGQTPEFKIENGNWYVRFGEGEWTYVGPASSAAAASLIASIDTTSKDGVVIFKLSNGTEFEVPTWAAASVKLQLVFDESPLANLHPGETASVDYEVIVPAGLTYTLDSYEPEGWEVTIKPGEENKGQINLTLPLTAGSGKILFAVTGSDGSCFVKIVKVKVSDPDPIETSYSIGAAGGQISLPAGEVTLPDGAAWLSLSEGVLNVAANTGYDSRSALVTVTAPGRQVYLITVNQAQLDAIVLSANTVEDVAAAGETLVFVIQTNVAVEASSDVDWIEVAPVTKGLEEKSFSFTVAENTETSARSGQVSFTDGTLTQTVTVKQLGVAPEPVTNAFTRVTAASELTAGDELLIVSLDGAYAMGAESDNNQYRQAVSISGSVVDNAIAEVPTGVAVITLEGSSTAWNLKVEDGYLAAQSAAKNYLVTTETLTNYGSWTISVTDGVASITSTSSASSGLLQYNKAASNRRFSCYKSTSGMQNVALYRRSAAPAAPVTAYSEPGLYLGGKQRVYTAGTDEYLRCYDGSDLTYVLVDPETAEQLVISGYKTTMAVGDAVSVSVAWKKGTSVVLSENYSMKVLADEGGKVWIGDDAGKGFILFK